MKKVCEFKKIPALGDFYHEGILWTKIGNDDKTFNAIRSIGAHNITETIPLNELVEWVWGETLLPNY